MKDHASNYEIVYLNDDGEENGKPGFGPQVVENKADQGVRRLKEKQREHYLKSQFLFILTFNLSRMGIGKSIFEWLYENLFNLHLDREPCWRKG